jgi:hypothetical protein
MRNNSSLFHSEKYPNFTAQAIVARLKVPDRIAALAAALEVSGDIEVGSLATALIDTLAQIPPKSAEKQLFHRSNSLSWLLTGTTPLVRHWARLSKHIRQSALQLVLEHGLNNAQTCAQDPVPRVRESVARFAGDFPTPTLAESVCDLLLDHNATVADAAEQSLILVCERLTGLSVAEPFARSPWDVVASAAPNWTDQDLSGFRARIATLCCSFAEHRRKGVLAAAILMLDPDILSQPEDPLARWLLDETQPSHSSLRALLRRGTGPLTRRRAWEWLSRPVVMAAALDRLATADTAADHDTVLSRAHLVENPDRARRWIMNSTPTGLPSPEQVAGLSHSARRGLPRLLVASRIDQNCAESILSPLLTDTDVVSRLAAAAALPAGSVLDYAFDQNESIGVMAALKWMHSGGADPSAQHRVATNLARSPHSSLRFLAAVHPPSWTTSLVSPFGATPSQATDALIDELRCIVQTGSPDERLRAITAARRCHAQRALEEDLLGLLHANATDEPAARAAGAAASALAEAGTGAAMEALTACLNHTVPRVRANAAEGLVQRVLGRGDLPFSEPRLYASLIEMKSDPSHRVRSSAVRAILRAASPDWGGTGYEPDAADALFRMLDDHRPMHRLAGVWAVEHATASPGESISRRWDHFASVVARLAQEDPDDAVQRRALWCARRMLIHAPGGCSLLRSAVEECAA